VRLVPQRNPAQHDEAVAEPRFAAVGEDLLQVVLRRLQIGQHAGHQGFAQQVRFKPADPARLPARFAATGVQPVQEPRHGRQAGPGPRTRSRSVSTASREGNPPNSVAAAIIRRRPAMNSSASAKCSAWRCGYCWRQNRASCIKDFGQQTIGRRLHAFDRRQGRHVQIQHSAVAVCWIVLLATR
jgi:hypothetical protein